jgi:hypothetical protein
MRLLFFLTAAAFGWESPKHAEIRLAILLKMLPIAHLGAGLGAFTAISAGYG